MISQIELNEKIRVAEAKLKQITSVLDNNPSLKKEKYPPVNDDDWTYSHYLTMCVTRLRTLRGLK